MQSIQLECNGPYLDVWYLLMMSWSVYLHFLVLVSERIQRVKFGWTTTLSYQAAERHQQ